MNMKKETLNKTNKQKQKKDKNIVQYRGGRNQFLPLLGD